jgi:hypothetical protein
MGILHLIGVLLLYVIKGILALIVLAVGGFTVVMGLAVILGPLFQRRN